jgi:acetylglutamate kinase
MRIGELDRIDEHPPLAGARWDLFAQHPTLVIKYGGAAMTQAHLQAEFAGCVATLVESGALVTVVHGGGSEVTRTAGRLGIRTHFVDGQRYPDSEMLEVIVMVLAGQINKRLTHLLGSAGAKAVGLCGIDGGVLVARKLTGSRVDLGLVGEVASVNAGLLTALMRAGYVPVIAPVAAGIDTPVYNVNADLAAAGVARGLIADHLVFMSDVPGVLVGGEVIPSLTVSECRTLIDSGQISGGMIPKVGSCIDAIGSDVRSVHIIDGRTPRALLDLVAGRNAGTRITPGVLDAAPEPVEEFSFEPIGV